MRHAAQPGEAADGDISQLLSAWKNGGRRALEKLDDAMNAVEETAEVLKVSPVTVMRDWSTAKAWLYRELTAEPDDGRRTLQTSR